MKTDREAEQVTLAEALGLTGELAGAIARLAATELEAGRPQAARTLLEGLAVSNPQDLDAWVLLSRTHRALGQPLAARFCAEVAAVLDPVAPQAQLVRAEALLLSAETREAGLEELRRLPEDGGPEAERARALLAAIEGA